MPSNEEAVRLLREIADLLDVLGEAFKPQAYRRAAQSIEGVGEDLKALDARGELDAIPGVGAAISEKLREYLRDGRIGYLDRLAREVPPGLVGLLKLPGVGPKTVRRFWTELGVEGPAELAAAIAAGRLDGVKGFGPTKIAQIRSALAAEAPSARIGLWEATEIADALVRGLTAAAPVDRIEIAGSYRRARETVGDLDLLVLTAAPEAVFDAFGRLPEVATIRLRGPTKETVVLRSGLQVDLRIVPSASYGAALQYFTGSKDHNVKLRTRARDLGLKVNEYAVYRGEEAIAGATEEDVYAALGLRYIPPEIREDRGEIEAVAAGPLAPLVAGSDLRADLHVHPEESEVPRAAALVRDRARAAGLSAVGVVLPAASAPALVADWRNARASADGPPALLVGLEGSTEELAATEADVDYRLLRAAPGGPPDASPIRAPVAAVVHLALAPEGRLEADASRLAPWLPWARSQKAALEVLPTAARDGLDSAGARRALEQGIPLLISGGAPGGPDARRLGVATALARRAGAVADRVLNASPGFEGLRRPRPSSLRRGSRTAPERG